MDNNQTPTPIPASAQTPPATSSLPQMQPVTQSKPSVELKNTSVGSSKSHTGLYIVTGVIIVLIALIGVAFWYINNNQKQVAPQPATVSTNSTQEVAKPQPTPEDFNSEINSVNIDDVDTSDIDKDLTKLQ
jgi:hypothetical protein